MERWPAPRGLEAHLWDFAAKRSWVRKIPIAMEGDAAITPDGSRLVAISPPVGRTPVQIAVCSLNTGASWTADAGACNTLAVSPDGRFVAAWKGLTPRDVEDLSPGRAGGRATKVEEHRFQLERQSNTVVRVWDLADGRVVADLAGHAMAVRAAAFSRDGKTFATAGEDGVIKFWDVVTGAEKATLNAHADGILTLAFSQSSRVLASAGRDGEIAVWTTGPLPAPSGGTPSQ
jgi:WD40 repeat protein